MRREKAGCGAAAAAVGLVVGSRWLLWLVGWRDGCVVVVVEMAN